MNLILRILKCKSVTAKFSTCYVYTIVIIIIIIISVILVYASFVPY